MTQAAHAAFGASNAARYMACPGSHRLTVNLPPSPSSRDALVGTAGHQMVARCLANSRQRRSNLVPGYAEEVEIEGGRYALIELDAEMIEAIRFCLAHADAWFDGAAYSVIEQRFSLADLDPPAAMFGTCDLAVVRPDEGLLVVTDWKFGRGVRVVAQNNPQLRYYGLGALLALGPDFRRQVKRVRLEIVQPRLPDGPAITSEELTLLELLDWAEDLIGAVKQALEPDALLVPGEKQCRWCPAAAVCPELRKHAEETAIQALMDDPPDIPPVDSLSDGDISWILSRAGLARMFLDRVQQVAIQRLHAGGTIPGFKLVAGQTRRVWLGSERETTAGLIDLGLSFDDITETKLRSPTQLEKLLPKPRRELLAPLVTRNTPGVVLAPATDKRPEITAGEGMSLPEPVVTEED